MALTYLHALWQVLLDLAPSLFLGAVIAGLLHGLLPRNFVGKHLKGPFGVAKAVLLGVPLPLCSCGVLPAAFGLKRDGASDGAAVGFLISTPQTGVDSIFVSGSLLGWPFALFKVVAAGVTGLFGGLLTEKWGGAANQVAAAGTAGDAHNPRGWRGMAEHAIELLRSIWGWLTLGVLISAAITTFLPPDLLSASGAGGTLWAMLLALAIGLPLYVCATASVPIAAALVAAGLPTGAALVFLMAGPATNAATVGALFRALGRRVTAIYLTTIILGSMAGGLLFESVWPSMARAGEAVHHHGATAAPWWSLTQMAMVWLLLGFLAFFAWEDLRRLWRRGAFTKGAAEVSLALPVRGMSCEGCVAHLERTLQGDPSVAGARVTLDPARAEVRGSISESRLRELIAEAGYEAL